MTDIPRDRRSFLRIAGGGAAMGLLGGVGGCVLRRPRARVVVVGGGFGGATAAKYIRLWDQSIEVVLVERNAHFFSCPMSNLVVSGRRDPTEIQSGYGGLKDRGIQLVHDEVTAVFPDRRMIRLATGASLEYDRLILSPGIDFLLDELPGCEAGLEVGRVLHAWKAGPQTLALRERLEAMPDGGLFVITVPPMPYRCPPGPYERVCQVADYFRREKPRSKIIMLDANPDIVSKGDLFRKAWAELYPGMIDYRAASPISEVDPGDLSVRTEAGRVRGDVLNVIPPQRAGEIARRAGLLQGPEDRWCQVEWRTGESLVAPELHVLGDATASAPGMPKSGHMANAQAKVCAAAVVAMLNDRPPDPDPLLTNTCYSFVSGRETIHVSSVHRWNAESSNLLPVPEAGGVSPERYDGADVAWSWAQNIWADMLR